MEILAEGGIELDQDRTLLQGSSDAKVLSEKLESCSAWIVVVGRRGGDSGWLDRETVRLLRNSERLLLPVHLPGFDSNPIYSALADLPGVPVLDHDLEKAAKLVVEVCSTRLAETSAGDLVTPIPQDLLDKIDVVAAAIHNRWMEHKLASGGWESEAAARRVHPDLVPYGDLSEEAKALDRATVVATIQALLTLGYEIEIQVDRTKS